MAFLIRRLRRGLAGIEEAGVVEHGGVRYVFFTRRAGMLAMQMAYEGSDMTADVRLDHERQIRASSLPEDGMAIDPDHADHLDMLVSTAPTQLM